MISEVCANVLTLMLAAHKRAVETRRRVHQRLILVESETTHLIVHSLRLASTEAQLEAAIVIIVIVVVEVVPAGGLRLDSNGLLYGRWLSSLLLKRLRQRR